MRTSVILGLRSLASKIHPPLPLSPREGQKLLSLLNESFRQQLDADSRTSINGEDEITNSHFKSILDSPLFSRTNINQKPLPNSQAPPHKGALKSVQHFVTAPVEHFRQEVADGSATLGTARQCLDACMKMVIGSPKSQKREITASFQVGAAVSYWLWSSGLQQSAEFLRDKRFLSLLLPFLIVEGHTSIVWRWFKVLQSEMKTYSSEEHAVPSTISAQGSLLQKYIMAQVEFGDGPRAGLAEFLKVTDQTSSDPCYTKNWSRAVLQSAGIELVSIICQTSPVFKASLSEYTKFQQSAGIWAHKKDLFDAIFCLYHPFQPDPTPALKCIKEGRVKSWESEKVSTRRTSMRLCLDTAQVLILKGRQADAKWVMDLTEQKFAEEIGSRRHQSPTKDQLITNPTNKSTEAANLRLLDHLALH